MPEEKKLLFITEATIEAYRAGMEDARQKIHEELLAPIFAAYARVKDDANARIPSILWVHIVAAQTRFEMSTPAQRACAAGFIEHDHDERGPRLE